MSDILDKTITKFINLKTFKQVSILVQQSEHVIYQKDFPLHSNQIDKAPSPVFLVASLTKPVLAMGILKLVEEGEITLNQRVADILPDFKTGGRIQITLRHLLSHTSGLPDLPPNNVELRKQEAPLQIFLEQANGLVLEFAPGKSSRYSSLGFMVLAAVIESVTQLKVSDFLHKTFFLPLGMHDTSLGLPADEALRDKFLQHLISVEMTPFEIEKFGDWNGLYWRILGAPWGGLLSTTQDLSRFCQMIYQHGTFAKKQILSPDSIKASVINQLQFYPDLPTEVQSRPWGLGWRLNWVSHRQAFSDILPTSVIGHYGATGSLMWIDLESQRSLVLLTSTPQERAQTEIVKLSNLVAAIT